MRSSRLVAVCAAALLTTGLAACSTTPASSDDVTGSAWEPVTIEHALGTAIETKPARVATVNWANHEVPLALGIVPVVMAAANFGDDDGDGILPWVEEKLEELGGDPRCSSTRTPASTLKPWPTPTPTSSSPPTPA